MKRYQWYFQKKKGFWIYENIIELRDYLFVISEMLDSFFFLWKSYNKNYVTVN